MSVSNLNCFYQRVKFWQPASIVLERPALHFSHWWPLTLKFLHVFGTWRGGDFKCVRVFSSVLQSAVKVEVLLLRRMTNLSLILIPISDWSTPYKSIVLVHLVSFMPLIKKTKCCNQFTLEQKEINVTLHAKSIKINTAAASAATENAASIAAFDYSTLLQCAQSSSICFSFKRIALYVSFLVINNS